MAPMIPDPAPQNMLTPSDWTLASLKSTDVIVFRMGS